MDKVIISLHIEKCGGTSILLALDASNVKLRRYDKNYHSRDIQCLVQEPAPVVLHGHVQWGIHQLWPEEPFEYVTVIRNPVDRWLSHWKHIIQRKRSNMRCGVRCNWETAGRAGPEVMLEENVHLQNWIVRRLAGVVGDKPVGQKDLEFAVNLLDSFRYVGALESGMDVICDEFSKIVGCEIKPLHINACGPTSRQVTPDELEAIREYNKWDLELYRRVIG